MSGIQSKQAPSIRKRLMLLVSACILPAFSLAVILIYDDFRLSHDSFVQSASATARANAMEIDKEFAPVEAALTAFSTSPNFSLRQLETLDAQARKLAAIENIFSVVLEDASGQQRLNTFEPYGASLPREADSPSLGFMRDQNKTFISSVFVGPVVRRQMVAVGIPARTVDGDWVALTATMPAERFASLLLQQHYPKHWVTSIVDRGGRVVASTVDMEKAVGSSVSPAVLEKIRARPEAVFETQARDGTALLMVTARALNCGWTVAIGIPLDELAADMRRKMVSLALATVGLLGAGMLCAWRIGTRISRAMHGLVAPALALGSGKPVIPVPHGVREAEQVGAALVEASHMLQRAQHQATHDALTGIANRAMFHSFLERQIAIAERAKACVSVLYLDLDNFKPINDTYGHAVGDQLLVEASSRLTSQLRKSDLAARLGGDEFAVVILGDEGESAIVAAKLNQLMAQPYVIEGLELSASASIGMATYPQAGESLSGLLAAADQAMYRSKSARKKRTAPTASA